MLSRAGESCWVPRSTHPCCRECCYDCFEHFRRQAGSEPLGTFRSCLRSHHWSGLAKVTSRTSSRSRWHCMCRYCWNLRAPPHWIDNRWGTIWWIQWDQAEGASCWEGRVCEKGHPTHSQQFRWRNWNPLARILNVRIREGSYSVVASCVPWFVH